MKNEKAKTQKERSKEIASLRQQIAELKQSERELRRAEEALRESEEELEAIFNDARLGIAFFDITGKILRVNKRILKVGGYTEKEVVGKRLKLLKMFPKKSLAKMLANFTKLFSGKKVPPFDVEVYTKGGEKLTTELHGSLVRKKGRVAGMIGIMRDITEHKQAEEALQESEEKYRTILETMHDAYFEADLAGTFTFVNDAACRHLGYAKEELIGMNNRAYTTPEAAEKIYKIFNTLYREGKSTKVVDYEAIRKDGTTIMLELSVSLMRDKEGEPIGFRGISRDVTERKKAEEALHKSEEKYRTILEAIEDGYYEVDLAGNFTFFNDSMCRIQGYTRDEMMGMNNRAYMDEKAAKKVYKIFNAVYRTGHGTTVTDWQIIRKDGSQGEVEASVSLMRDAGGNPTGFRGIVRDITERRRTEELLKKERETFYSTLQEAPNGVALIDKDGSYLYLNAEFTNITGYTLKDIPTGREWFNKAYPDPQYRREAINAWKKDFKSRALDRIFSITCKDGTVKEIEFRGTMLQDDRSIVILTDITERKRAEEAYHAVVEHSLQGLHILQNQREVFANSAYAEMLGYTVEELLALSPKQVKKLVHPDDQEIAWGRIRDRIEGRPAPPRYEFRIIRKDGSVRWVESFPSRIEYRGKPALQVAMIDITERKEAEATLRNSEERYRTLVESSTDAILMLDRERNVVTCNQAFLALFGYRKGEVEGKSIRIIHPSMDSFRSYGEAAYTLVERVGSLREEWDFMRKDGTIFLAEIVTSPIRAPDGTATGYICIIRDITERKRAEEELEYMATHDALSGLPNRTLFTDRLSMALIQARRSQKTLAVMMLDLDYFKDVNDSLGHSVGDHLLRAVGNRLRELLRQGDTVARIGGDEFLLLLPEIARVEDAITIAQKILEGFRSPFVLNDHEIYITASIGIAIYPDDDDADILIKNADAAMYCAKDKGRDTFERYLPEKS